MSSPSGRSVRLNFKILNSIAFTQLFLIFMPIMVPLFGSYGLDMQQIFLLQSVFGATLLLCEVPSGYIADLFGRKRAMNIGYFAVGVGFTVLMFATDFWTLVVFEVFLGIGFSMISGSDVAILYDSEEELGDHGKNRIGNLAFCRNIGETVAALLGGLLALHSWELVLQAQAVVGWAGFACTLFLVEPVRKISQSSHTDNFASVMQQTLKQPFLRWMLAIWILASMGSWSAAWMYQKYWTELEVNVALFGVMWAAANGIVAIGAKLSLPLANRIGKASMLIVLACLPVAGYLSMALFSSVAGIALGLLINLSRGFHVTFFTDWFNQQVTGEFRATANSIKGMLFRIATVLIGPMIGMLADNSGTSVTFIVIATTYATGFALLITYQRKNQAQLPA
ncbi:MFS transporter [Salinibius halmophilus]|uniref:MFS transporter n=1 Tax=Salinibius halmophilus TaxID=1853216 RepID=UPI001314854B|nr:MFS transporter [Salinibius halmophilus]